MERRYLAATLALAATFAIFSREFRSGYLAKIPTSQAQFRADIACAKQYVAERVMAKLQPYVDRAAPEQAQMMAELNLPEVVRVQQRLADEQVQLARQLDLQKCSATVQAQRAAMRAQLANERAIEIRDRAAERAQQIQEMAVIRAQELSARATERAQQINLTTAVRAQALANRSLARAQCALDKSHAKMMANHPQVQGMPIHINFQVPAPRDFTFTVPPAPATPSPTNF